MEHTLRIFTGRPDYETLPAAKIICYPLEKGSYKPYAQGRICVSPEGLHIHLLSFESESLPKSSVCAVLQGENTPALECCLYADGTFEILLGENPLEKITVHPLSGEDMQGVYWGGVATIPLDVLTKEGFTFLPKETLHGNFYKLCEDERKSHYGCFAPADFKKLLNDPSNLCAIRCIDY